MVTYDVTFSDDYHDDLIQIISYLKTLDMYQENRDKMIRQLIEEANRLGESPYIGHRLDEVSAIPNDYRVLKTGRYLQFYKVDDSESVIKVLRVMDGRTAYLAKLNLDK